MRTKYARLWLELDLGQPLQQGTWVHYGDSRIFVVVFDEKLPVFYYNCRHVGHRESKCSFVNSCKSGPAPHQPYVPLEHEMMVEDPTPLVGKAGEQTFLILDGELPDKEAFSEFGPWLIPRKCSHHSLGRGWSRACFSNPVQHGVNLGENPNAWPLACQSNRHVDRL